MAIAKKLDAIEEQMRALALAIDSSYARTGFSPDNIRLNREFDVLEALYYNSSASASSASSASTTKPQRIQRTASTHAHLFSISRKNLIRARAARSSYFASTTAASSFIGSPIRQLRVAQQQGQQGQQQQTPKKQQQRAQSALRRPITAQKKPQQQAAAPVAKAKATRARFLGD